MFFVDNQQENKIFSECSRALFTDEYKHCEKDDNNKENESFSECSQSILQNISKKVKLASSSCQNKNYDYDTDTSIEEIMDSEDECEKNKTEKLRILSKFKNKSTSNCCAAKKYFDGLFSKNFNAELNTQNELPPIYAQFEHDLGMMLAFRLRNVPANKRLECYEKLINVVRQYTE